MIYMGKKVLFISLMTFLINSFAYSQQVQYEQFIYKGKKEDGYFQKFLNMIREEPFTGSYAIIIAIGAYDHLSPLKSAKRDAEKMKDFLLNTGEYDEVVVLQDTQASFETIRYFMQTYFPKKMMKKGRYRFLFYFTGHGTQEQGYGGNTIGYLLLKGAIGSLSDSETIDMNQVENWANRFRHATHVLFLLDSCFSGLAGTEIKKYDTRVNPLELARENGRFMITAGGANETSIADLKRWDGSLFTDVIIHGMKGHADVNSDGVITTYELFNYVQAAVKNEAQKVKHSQNPLIHDLGSYKDKGQYFFVYKEPNLPEIEEIPIIDDTLEKKERSGEKPIPSNVPISPTPKLDEIPSIILLAEVPSETEQQTISIQGIVTNNTGIKDVEIIVNNQRTKALAVADISREQNKFSKKIQLEIGKNLIEIEALDTRGQVAKKVITVMRVAPVAASLHPLMKQRENIYAVVIGIGTYQDPRLNLRYTANDAQGLYELLIDPNWGGLPEDHVQLLLNEQATDRNIKSALGKWLWRQATEDSTVIIYYSGHGAPEGDETFWVTYNADIDDLYATALSNNEVGEILDRIRSKHLIMFLDACYNAAIVHRKNSTRTGPTEIPWDNFVGEGRVTISASDGKQLSLELDEYQHGVFTYYLLEGLKGKADKNSDYMVDVLEIWDYLKYRVTQTAQKVGNPQTPVLQGMVRAGSIPLTINIKEMQRSQKKERLTELFEQKHISSQKFECALKMLNSGEPDPFLEDLLSGKFPLSDFDEVFVCSPTPNPTVSPKRTTSPLSTPSPGNEMQWGSSSWGDGHWQ